MAEIAGLAKVNGQRVFRRNGISIKRIKYRTSGRIISPTPSDTELVFADIGNPYECLKAVLQCFP